MKFGEVKKRSRRSLIGVHPLRPAATEYRSKGTDLQPKSNRTHWLGSRLGMLVVLSACLGAAQSIRPPAVPLVTHNPYFSIWSMNDRLTDGPTRHWTGTPEPLAGLIRIDGKTFRWMGSAPHSIPALEQTGLEVTPTHTLYHFAQAGVRFTVSFLSPLLPSDLDVLSRPVSYVTVTASSADASKHDVQVLFEVPGDLAVNTRTEDLVWSRARLSGMVVLRASNFKQPVLEKSGDDLRIDWGQALLGVPDQPGSSTATQSPEVLLAAFNQGQGLPPDDMDAPRRADQAAALAVDFDLRGVGEGSVARHILLAYDDFYSIEYLNRWLRPYWRRQGMTTGELLEKAERDYPDLE